MMIGGNCMGEVHYMISEAAKRVNMEAHVLRHWEEELGLSIGRTEMGHRYYTEEDIRLFRCIKELKEQGILLKELKELIPDMVQARAKRHEKKEPLSELQEELLKNNILLQEMITNTISKEMEIFFRAQDAQEEERYKKIDSLIRQQQNYRKEYTRVTPLKQLRRIFEG